MLWTLISHKELFMALLLYGSCALWSYGSLVTSSGVSSLCTSTLQLGCRMRRFWMKGRMMARPVGGAVSDNRANRLINAAIRDADKCLKFKQDLRAWLAQNKNMNRFLTWRKGRGRTDGRNELCTSLGRWLVQTNCRAFHRSADIPYNKEYE